MITARSSTITNFTKLKSWQEAHQLALEIHRITKAFPKEERYSLIDQMRRCAVSVSSNIAEGFSRFSGQEKRQFYAIAKGSLTELQNQLLYARDINYLNTITFDKVARQGILVSKLITGLIRSATDKK